jgi:streptogramin lyase
MRNSLLSILCVLGVVALNGCSGVVSFPDTSVPGSAIHPGAIKGSVFGGHAPVVGADVYVYEVGQNGYGSASVSKLTSGTQDGNKNFFTTTDSTGAFNITDDYTCDVGEPVYIVAIGGSTGGAAGSNATINITSASETNTHTGGNGKNEEFTYTITFVADNSLNVGQGVTFAGLSGEYGTFLNGTTQTVTATTGTTFTVVFGPNKDTITDTDTGGTATATFAANPAIVNMAMLGNCPGGNGEFANTISFVYLNEVATVAAVDALAGFGTGPLNIGAPSTNLLGIQNAAANAGQLYNITAGGQALATTNYLGAGNGMVPQTKLNTLGNILAACVDSVNTANSATEPDVPGASASCTSLFEHATSNGIAFGTRGAGTVPTDIATAAFNIAHNPGSNTADIFAVQNASTTPYLPDLTDAPNDFTITIVFTGGGVGVTGGQSPHAVAIDGSGNVYTLNFALSNLSIFSPLGVPANATGFDGNGLNGPGSVAIDAASQNVWLSSYSTGVVSEFTTAGVAVTNFSATVKFLQDAEVDGSGNIWVTSNVIDLARGGPEEGTENALVELNSSGTVEETITDNVNTPFAIAFEPGVAGDVWIADFGLDDAGECTRGTRGTCTNFAGNEPDIENPIGVAIDATGNAWFTNDTGTVSKLTNTGGSVEKSPFATGARREDYSDGIAIDGAGDVWVTNSLGGTVYELNNAGTEITTQAGYTAPTGVEPDGLAIDGSGNLWYDSLSTAALYEVVGVATPVVTPLSNAVAQTKLGREP